MRTGAASVVVLLIFVATASAADCPALPPQGAPTVSVTHGTVVCQKAYEAFVDDDARVPRWVAYTLTGPHSLGCGARSNNFHKEPKLPAGSAAPSDYDKTGYDKGHQAPAEDFTWDATAEQQSFSMANMAPQAPGLNRQQWERLEETVRAWATERGPLSIYVGPVLGTKTIGRGRINVPLGFWKVVEDKGGAVIAFYMANKKIAKGPLNPQLTTVGRIEAMVGIKLPVPDAYAAGVWPVDLTAFRKARERACSN